jgi:ribonucleoside-diphosphate reductase alpha chain
VYDEAVSKTVNLPKTATVDDVVGIFVEAYDLGLKNISVYRDGSYDNQPVNL